jgi:hypothetical protein
MSQLMRFEDRDIAWVAAQILLITVEHQDKTLPEWAVKAIEDYLNHIRQAAGKVRIEQP